MCSIQLIARQRHLLHIAFLKDRTFVSLSAAASLRRPVADVSKELRTMFGDSLFEIPPIQLRLAVSLHPSYQIFFRVHGSVSGSENFLRRDIKTIGGGREKEIADSFLDN